MENHYEGSYITGGLENEEWLNKFSHPQSCKVTESFEKENVTSFLQQKYFAIPYLLKENIASLSTKKYRLEQECLRLKEEIISRQETLSHLQSHLDTSGNHSKDTSTCQLAAGLAHEIRNPLTTIKGFIQLLMPDLNSAGRIELAQIAMEEIDRANGLLSEFLSVLKPDGSCKRKIPITSLTNSMIKLFSSEAMLKDVKLTVNVPEETLLVSAEENKIKQVLMNLLKNAFEAAEENREEKGQINVSIQEHNNFAELSVVDNGPGIKGIHLERIFHPYFTTKEKGTGIGLFVCKRIIEEHGGTIHAESNKGYTRFSFTLPIIQ